MKYWSHIYVIEFVYTFPRSYHKVTIHFMNIFCESSITHSKYVKYRPIIVNCFSNWSSLTIVMPRPPFNSSLFMCYGEMDFNKITANFDCFFFLVEFWLLNVTYFHLLAVFWSESCVPRTACLLPWLLYVLTGSLEEFVYMYFVHFSVSSLLKLIFLYSF